MSEEKRKTVKFNEDGINNLPENKPALYKILNKNDVNIYTGVAKRGRIKDRLKEHLPSGPDPISGGTKVQIQQKKSINDAKKSENWSLKEVIPDIIKNKKCGATAHDTV